MGTTMDSASLDVRLKWDYRNAMDLATAYDKPPLIRNTTRDFTDGIGDNEFNTVWHDRRLITPSTATDLIDLSGGLTDAFGNTIVFTAIKMIYIENLGVKYETVYTPTEDQDILVGGAASLCFASLFNNTPGSEVTIRSGGVFCVSAPLTGWPVIAGSEDILSILLNGTGQDIWYDIVIWGVR